MAVPVQPLQPGGATGVGRVRVRAARLREHSPNAEEKPMLAKSYTWGADKKSIVFTDPRRRAVERRPAVHREGRRVHLQPDEEVPGDRPLLAVDGCRSDERHRGRQQGDDEVQPGGPAVLLLLRQRGRHRARAHLGQRRRRGAPGHLGGQVTGRYRPVHGQPLLGQQHPVHGQSEVLAAGQAVHPEGRVPRLPRQRAGEPRPRQRQGPVGQPVHPQHPEVLSRQEPATTTPGLPRRRT